MSIFLRPTGCSLLIGYIDLGPGDVQQYIKDLKSTLDELRQCHQVDEPQEDLYRAFPRDHYQMAAYLGVGVHNLLTFALVREQGFATKIAFLGNVHGQTYFHAHDYSIVLDVTTLDSRDSFHGLQLALRDLDLSTVLKVSPNDHRVTCTNEKAKKKERHKAYVFEDGDVSMKYCVVYINPQEYKEKARQDEDHLFFGELRPLTFDRIDCGHIPGWSQKGHGKECSSRKYLWRRKRSGEFRKPTKPDEVIYFTQLRINSFPLMKYSTTFRNWAYLGIVLTLHRNVKGSDYHKDQLPSFYRIFFTDGYFDMGVILRGFQLEVLLELMQAIKYLTLGDVKACLCYYGLAAYQEACWSEWTGDLDEHTPVFVISNSSLGIPYPKIDKARVNINHWNKVSIKKQYKSYEKELACYGTKKQARSRENSYLSLRASTRLSIKNCRTHEVLADVSNLTRALKLTENKNVLLKGRFDLDLFSYSNIPFGLFLARLFVANDFLQRQGFRNSGTPFYQRLNSPILHIQSTIGTSLALGSNDRPVFEQHMAREIYPGLKEGVTGLLSRENLQQQLRIMPVNTLCENARRWLDELETDKNGSPNQLIRFDHFLKEKFASEVSSETLERFTSTLSVVDNLLCQPLLFDAYLDIRRYCNYYLKAIFSIKPSSSLNEVGTLDYYDVKTGCYRSYKHSVDNTIGYEAFFLSLANLLQKVLDQRQAGSFPEYDRCISRLTDLRLQHLKRICALSWMVDNIRSAFMWPASKIDTRFKISGIHVPVYFSNTPEVLCDKQSNALLVNARLLTSNEQLISVVHETGHLFFHDLLTFYKEPACFWHYWEEIKTKEGDTHWPSSENELHSITARPVRRIRCSQKLEIEPNLGSAYLWEEVFSDLFVFRCCFAPLENILFIDDTLDKNKKKKKDKIYTSSRVKVRSGINSYDLYDDFILAWFFQLMAHPKILNKGKFNILMLRIFICYSILKILKYEDTTQKDQSDLWLDRVWKEDIPYLLVKMERLIFKITKAKENVSISDSSIEQRMHLLNWTSLFWQLDVREEEPEFKDQHPKVDPNKHFRNKHFRNLMTDKALKSDFDGQMRSLIDCFEHHASGLSKKDIIANHLLSLALPPEVAPCILKPRLKKKNDLFPILQGIWEEPSVAGLTSKEQAESFFASALQLAGIAMFGFVQDFQNPNILFVEGYPRFTHHDNQRKLARIRRLISSSLMRGKIAAIRHYLEESNISLKRYDQD